ncbi:hypothetical protein F5887DRAFT_1281640 [Amanita rubescens]|nr:hypothetical protein F5887DRAFT_1281640 [Amanita rubescens]
MPTSSSQTLNDDFPALKHRRVSLALPSAPRLVQPWAFRDDTSLDAHPQQPSDKRPKIRKNSSLSPADDLDHPHPEKKPRKKWSPEETQMLVDGCQRHGVGNWKTILSDPDLKFDNRSPVDLKDRFRTYFPDAYKQHYPNARTHLSSKVRSMLPDGTPLFEKTRSKKRRPFTEEEDRALRAGYEKHGTVWAAIVKDPIFQEQNRRSTDLRDRFRNAFPDLYQAAGYKPRNSARKKQLQHSEPQQPSQGSPPKTPMRAATDDQLALSSTGPVRSRRRSHTAQGLFRGGTKSVPQSTACSEDEDSSGGEDESELVSRHPPTPVFVENVSTGGKRYKDKKKRLSMLSSFEAAVMDDDDEMEMVTIDQLTDPLFLPPPNPSWSSPSTDTLANSSHAWSSPASSSTHMSPDLMLPQEAQVPVLSNASAASSNNMIGNSAWGAQDWFSPNPRLDPTGGADTSSTSSVLDSNSGLFPASPLSFLHNNYHLSQGVMDRYDLFPASVSAAGLGGFGGGLGSGAAGSTLGVGGISGVGGGSWFNDFSSEIGTDTHSTFSDEMFPPTGFRGFTHHSNYAGDLIFGARTHQPPLQNWYSPLSLGFDSSSVASSGTNANASGETEANATSRPSRSSGTSGLGLSGVSAAQANGIHPLQLHTPSLVGIDDIELAGITLDDRPDTPAAASPPSAPKVSSQTQTDPSGVEVEMGTVTQQDTSRRNNSCQLGREQGQKDDLHERFSLDDLVDLSAHDDDGDNPEHSPWSIQQRNDRFNRETSVDVDFDIDLEDHTTPPATPLIPSCTLNLRRASHHFLTPGGSARMGGSGQHARSISVPPSEARSPAYAVPGQYHDFTPYLLCSPRPLRSATQPAVYSQSHSQPHLVDNTSSRTALSKSDTDFSSNPATIAPQLLLSSGSITSGHPDRVSAPHGIVNGMGGNPGGGDVPYDLPFLDLHYYGLASGSHTAGSSGLGGIVSAAGMLFDEPLGELSTTLVNTPMPSSSSSQALDLAQSQGAGIRYHGASDAQSHVVRTRDGGDRKPVGSQPVEGTTPTRTTATHQRHHHRGQSVASVCPQDLVLKKDRVDNKRKRASWDGFDGVYG